MEEKDIVKRLQFLAAINSPTAEEVEETEKLTNELSGIKARRNAEKALKAAEAEAEATRKEEMELYAQQEVQKAMKQFEAQGNRLPMGQAPYQTQYSDTTKYDGMHPADLAILIDLQKSFKAKGMQYANGGDIVVTEGAMKAMAFRVAELKPDTNTGDPIKNEENRQVVEYIKNAFKANTRGNIEPTKDAIEHAFKASKAATDPMYTGGSGIGSDWVGTNYSTALWEKIRASTRVVANIPSVVIPDGYSSETFPIEGADVTWYKVPEVTTSDSTMKIPAATVTASQIATANKNITVGKLGARGMYSGELTEDSLIRFAPQLRNQGEISGSEMLESLVIDGDVETSANKNINSIDGTPGSTDYYLSFDGFRKLALVTNTANSLSAGGSLTVESFLSLLKLMGTAGIAGADPSKVNFIVDGNTYYAVSNLPELKTRDVHPAATIVEGLIDRVYKVGVIPSWQMCRSTLATPTLLANTAGKVATGTPANNTTGTVVAVRWDQWKLAYKRRMTMELTRRPESDSWDIVFLTRLGLGYRDNEASAVLYNVGV